MSGMDEDDLGSKSRLRVLLEHFGRIEDDRDVRQRKAPSPPMSPDGRRLARQKTGAAGGARSPSPLPGRRKAPPRGRRKAPWPLRPPDGRRLARQKTGTAGGARSPSPLPGRRCRRMPADEGRPAGGFARTEGFAPLIRPFGAPSPPRGRRKAPPRGRRNGPRPLRLPDGRERAQQAGVAIVRSHPRKPPRPPALRTWIRSPAAIRGAIPTRRARRAAPEGLRSRRLTAAATSR